MSRQKAVLKSPDGSGSPATSVETNEETIVTKPSLVSQQPLQPSGDPSCKHEKTIVKNYNRKTLLGELWCHTCGGYVKEYDHDK